MVGLGSATPNTLTGYQSNVAIKDSNVKNKSIAEAEAASSNDNIFTPNITTNTDAQDEADRQNTARLAAIGVKEAMASVITTINWAQITNPILCMTDGSDFQTVNE